MSVFATIKKDQPKVHYSQYIRTENVRKADEADTKPAETANPEQTEVK